MRQRPATRDEIQQIIADRRYTTADVGQNMVGYFVWEEDPIEKFRRVVAKARKRGLERLKNGNTDNDTE